MPCACIVTTTGTSNQQNGVTDHCCQLVYIFSKCFKFDIFSKCLMYKFILIWYVWKIWNIFGVFLSEGLVWILTSFLVYYKAKTEKPIVVLKLYKKFADLLKMGVSIWDEHGSGWIGLDQDWSQFWLDQDWIGLQFFWKLAGQTSFCEQNVSLICWAGLTRIGELFSSLYYGCGLQGNQNWL